MGRLILVVNFIFILSFIADAASASSNSVSTSSSSDSVSSTSFSSDSTYSTSSDSISSDSTSSDSASNDPTSTDSTSSDSTSTDSKSNDPTSSDSTSNDPTSTDSTSSDSTSNDSTSSAPVVCPGGKKQVKCGPNEEFSNCTQTLGRRLKCSQQGKPVPCTTKPKRCRSGCVCIAGYLKTSNGTCVPESQCYGDLVCDDTEVVNSCPKKRINDFCPKSEKDSKESSLECESEKCGKPVCTCRFNYKRDPKSRKCIPTRNCPPFKCSGFYEKYNACPPICPTDSCSQATPSGRCPIIGRIGIVLECKPTCRCIKGYWRDNGTCVPYLECPGKCPPNEKFSSCIQGECRALNCTQKDQPIACPSITKESCQEGCVCVEGTLRLANGSCVSEDKCPVVCSANEEFSNCTQAVCRELNCSQRGQPLDCQSANSSEEIKESCQSGCICKAGYLKTAYGTCVPVNQCYGDLVCKDTEVVNTCPNYGFSDYCPRSEEEAQLSTKVVSEPCAKDPECTCKFNYKRVENGTCVPTVDCPPFKCSGKNQKYNPCPPLCASDDCSHATPDGRCKTIGRIGIVLPCRPNCHCITGYWKNNGVCVPYAACPGKCPPNEEFSSCAQGICRAENCSQKGQPIACPAIEEGSCEERCVCVEGTLRNANETCVSEDQCPAPTCGENEVLTECTSACSPVDCPKSYKEEQAWRAECISAAVCLPTKCRCLPDYRRNSEGKCIYIGECPGICPKNEEFSNCIQGCGRAQNCTESQPISSPVGERSCESGCICKEGMLRDPNGTCVPKDQCPAPQQPQCGQNEVLSCVHDCPPEIKCRTRGIQYDCMEPTKKCENKCVCKSGHYRNAIGQCITGKECDMCKGLNQFFTCGPECDNVCADMATQNRTNCPKINIMCNRKCYCEDGFARDDKDQCIPVEKCPKSKNCKGPNEEYVKCKQTCPSELCVSIVSRKNCTAEPPCKPGCACKSGFFRANENSPCGPVCDCIQMKDSPDCPKKHY